MKASIPFSTALQRLILTEHPKPVISRYELVGYMVKLYRTKTYAGLPIGKLTSDLPQQTVIERNLDSLVNKGILTQFANLPVFAVAGLTAPTAQQVICTLNPFCYLSHLSAMEWHHLTDRIPHTVHVTTCTASEFRRLAEEKAKQDLLPFPALADIPCKHHKPGGEIQAKTIQEHTRKDYHPYPEQHGSGGIRVAPIGRTFLDMLQEPDYCGGFSHVLEVFTEYAGHYLPVILKTIDKEGKAIDKVRVGYILQERLGHQHPTIEGWKALVQRGGSRKLLATEPYKDSYSETWCISVNLPDGNRDTCLSSPIYE